MTIAGGAGVGSTPEITKVLIEWLPRLVEKLDIHVVNDAGCGNLQWIERVEWDVDYLGYDSDPLREGIVKLDITQEPMRKADLIICKDVFRHLTNEQIAKAISLFNATYLICDTDEGVAQDRDRDDAINMRHFLGDPLELIASIEERQSKPEGWLGKFFGLWAS